MSTPTATNLNVFLDSDGPIADFRYSLNKSGLSTHEFKHRAGTYLWLSETHGARDALETLHALDKQNILRVWIATKTPTSSPYAYTEKVLWYREHFPWLEDRLILAHDKSQLGRASDVLLDDRPHKGNASLFRGTFILFKEDEPIQSWMNLTQWVDKKVQTLRP